MFKYIVWQNRRSSFEELLTKNMSQLAEMGFILFYFVHHDNPQQRYNYEGNF